MALDNINIHKVIQKSYEDAETKSNPQAELLGKSLAIDTKITEQAVSI